MLILKDDAVLDDGRVLQGPDQVPPHTPVLLPLAAWTQARADGRVAADGVVLGPGDDLEAAWPRLREATLIAIEFASCSDGRGYSIAQILRRRGYLGELRALGEVARDQVSHLRRCGFTSYAVRDVAHAAQLRAGLRESPAVYQAAADGRTPIARLRASVT